MSDGETRAYWAESGATLPTPQPMFVAEAWTGNGFRGNRGLRLKLTDAHNDLYTDPDLDARIELLRYRERKAERRHAGFVHPSNWVGGADISGQLSRGGGHYDDAGNPMPDRITEWALLGLDDHILTPRVEMENYYGPGTITNELTSTSVTAPVLRGSKQTNYDSGEWNPRWVGKRMDMFLRFRVTIIDPDGDGTPGDRLAGSESVTVRVAPYPYPVSMGGVEGTRNIGVGMADGPIYG